MLRRIFAPLLVFFAITALVTGCSSDRSDAEAARAYGVVAHKEYPLFVAETASDEVHPPASWSAPYFLIGVAERDQSGQSTKFRIKSYWTDGLGYTAFVECCSVIDRSQLSFAEYFGKHEGPSVIIVRPDDIPYKDYNPSLGLAVQNAKIEIFVTSEQAKTLGLV